jgi:uncharacterized protein
MKRITVLLASIVTFSLSTLICAQPTVEAKQLAKEIIELSMSDTLMQGVRQSTGGMIQQMQKQIGDQKLNQKQQEIMQRFTSEMMDDMLGPDYMGKVKDAMLDVFAETYTLDELRGIRDFYRSPAGVAFIQKTPQAMSRAMPSMQAALGPMMERMKARSAKLTDELKAAQ